jgi:hypothetical protein
MIPISYRDWLPRLNQIFNWVEVHPQLSNNWHPLDGALVGGWFTVACEWGLSYFWAMKVVVDIGVKPANISTNTLENPPRIHRSQNRYSLLWQTNFLGNDEFLGVLAPWQRIVAAANYDMRCRLLVLFWILPCFLGTRYPAASYS